MLRYFLFYQPVDLRHVCRGKHLLIFFCELGHASGSFIALDCDVAGIFYVELHFQGLAVFDHGAEKQFMVERKHFYQRGFGGFARKSDLPVHRMAGNPHQSAVAIHHFESSGTETFNFAFYLEFVASAACRKHERSNQPHYKTGFFHDNAKLLLFRRYSNEYRPQSIAAICFSTAVRMKEFIDTPACLAR